MGVDRHRSNRNIKQLKSMGSENVWYLFALRGFAPVGEGWTLEDPLWNDATIVSRGFVRATLKEGHPDSDEEAISEFELASDEPEEPGDWEHETRRFASVRAPDGFIAVLSSGSQIKDADKPLRYDRALEIAAMLGLTMSVEDSGERLAVHDQPRSHIGPIWLRLNSNGEFEELKRGWPAGTGVGKPRVVSRNDFERSLRQGSSISFKSVPLSWDVSDDIDLVRILTTQGRKRTKFEKLISRAAVHLFETFHRLESETKLLRHVTVLEMLLGGAEEDGGWNAIRRRANSFAAQAGVPWFYEEGIGDVFDARNEYVHEGNAVSHEVAMSARRIATDFLFHVAAFSHRHKTPGSFFRELEAQEKLRDIAEKYAAEWDQDQRDALDDVTWGSVFGDLE